MTPSRSRGRTFTFSAKVIALVVLVFIALTVALWLAWSRDDDTAVDAAYEGQVQPSEVPAPLPPARTAPVPETALPEA